MINQTTILETLSYLLGENSVPTSSIIDSRKRFIQHTLEEIYRSYPWTFAQGTATLTFASGLATMPSDFDSQQKVYSYFNNGDQQTTVTEINVGDQDMWETGDYKFWIEPLDETTYLLKTKDNNYTDLTIKYQKQVPTINASIATPFPDAMTIALGARRYVKLGQNPDADISQDEALFQKRLTENIAAQQLGRPLKKNRKIYYANNYRLGAE
jgi:hypothetical protein